MSHQERNTLPVVTVSANIDQWLTIGEAAAIVGMKLNTMYTLCLRRTVPSYKIGKMRRVKKSELLEWMNSNRIESGK